MAQFLAHDMTGRKAAIICASHHHSNTRRVAEVMASAIGADLFEAESADSELPMRYDLIGLGSGIYFGRPDRCLRSLVGKMAAGSKDVFLFSTSGLPFLSCLWHRALKRELMKKGYTLAGEFSCRGWDTVGPLSLIGGLNRHHPDENDLRRAAAFARSLQYGPDERAEVR